MQRYGSSHYRSLAGFTLLETLLAIIIVGVGVTAAINLFATCAQQNQESVRMTVATNLANNIQELTASASYTDPRGQWGWGLESGETLNSSNGTLDLDDFNGASFNPPVDAGWQPQPQLSQYTQTVSVARVKHTDFNTIVTSDEGVRKVTVKLSFKKDAATAAKDVYTLVFLRFNDSSNPGPSEH